MYGHHNRFRGGPRQPPPPPPPASVPNPNVFFQPQPSFSSHNLHLPNTAWPLPFQNPLGFTPHHQQQQQQPPSIPPPPQPQNPKHEIDRVNRAADKAFRHLLAAGDSVSAWKVSQNALLTLQVDSWNSLGIKMQQVPVLHCLMITEGKVNAFIHCFVGVRRITSLYDLEVAICKNECVDNFEALGMGPLLRHPLVIHYFSIHSDVTQVFKITSEEITQLLCELDSSKRKEIIRVDEFLDFIAKKRSVKCREWLGIRIQNLGMHISAIREARNSEESILEKCLKTLRLKKENFRKRPISSSYKKQLDERFSAIAQRVESFSSENKSFCGKYTRFKSSSSEDEGSDYSTDNDKNNNIITGSWSKASSQFGQSSERVSSCPYPSATEEMARLGVGVDMQGHSLANSNLKKGFIEPPKKKRKSENVTYSKSAPSKLLKKNKIEVDVTPIENGNTTKATSNVDEDLSIANDSLQLFVSTWKEACWEHNVAEVLERMLRFYEVKPGHRRKIRMMCSSYPFIGLLNTAVSSIKSGMWNSIYDTFQAINHNELTNSPTKSSEYETIDVGPSLENIPVITEDSTENTKCISAEDIIRKIGTYFDLNNEVNRNSNSLMQCRIMLLRKFCNCESWVAEQFGVKNFTSLGYGDFLLFLEKYVNQLPHELLKLLDGGTCENSSSVAYMSSNQLAALVSQACSSLWKNETVTKQMISVLLMRQFPSIGFEVLENVSLEDLLDTARVHKSSVTSECVLFSATMIEKYYLEDSLGDRDNNEITTDRSKLSQYTISSGSVTTKNAIEVLLKAPMLSDLSKWSHWDLMFAPFLGSFISWLLNDVNSKELFCLVTRDGKVIRIDCSATPDSFLEAAVQGSSFQTAVNLLSLISLDGGEKRVRLSLLKYDACRAFEVMFRKTLKDIEVGDDGNALQSEEALCKTKFLTEISTTKMRSEFRKDIHKLSKVVPILSRFVLECLGYLPAEFHSFASDVLLSGMQSVCKDAASAILCECSNMEQRLMLHEVGLSLGISEWINDYHAFISKDTSVLCCARVTCLKDAKTEISTSLKHDQEILDKSPVPEAKMVACGLNEGCTEISRTIDSEKSNDESITGCLENSFQTDEHMDAALIIKSIRRDEFGLDPSLSDSESCMLKKQHARLGRALHCLSQELYSQDSHFILELVQNADDNNYPENVEPTLTFILQNFRIVVLNNERGFSAQNMRALCDVGSSTKKGSNAGYIGKKGIGFKSVFRVTDAPEIHSNGFHVKFDISEGQIGFVLPTEVPPCDIGSLSRMASTGADSYDDNSWNTCIVLPFRSHLSEGTDMKSMMTMFADLHPSLLLFLHRLKCIKLRNLVDDTHIVMRKETLGDGIIKVSHGKEKMAWFVVSEKLHTNSIRFDVRTTEISMAFTLQESDGGYSPCLDQQPVFAFLPLRTYGLKFILQGDFVLPSSREEVDGDSPWNQWLLSEYPNLFVRAEREFCELPCFRSEPGKGLSAFMSFVPLVGEVHGFFSSLPRLIILKLQMMNCLLVEGDNNGWVRPCKVLRGWTEQVRCLLPDNILLEHLGLRYLDKNIVLSDTLARALGIEEFGPNILVRVLSSLCHTKSGLISMGMSWLASCLTILYETMFNSSVIASINFEMREDILKNLKKIPFIPLSDGTYSSVDEGTIWLQSNTLNTGFDGELKIEAFPNICAKLRTVSPSLFSASSGTLSLNMTFLDNATRLLQSIGVQQLSVHDVVKLHILPALSDKTMANKNKMLMVEYMCFVMLHLKSTCSDCFIEREHIISELRCKSLLLTNYGFKCPAEVPIHFSTGFGNPVTPKMLADVVNMRWHEVDISYLKHPVNELVSSALMKWREFFEQIGITDFAQIVPVDKSVVDVLDATFKQVMWDRGQISTESIVKDWESPEIVQLVSLLSKIGNQESCKYLLEVLDTLWDACYSDKTTGYFDSKSVDGHSFKSTFICSLCNIQWVVSTIDGELHYPKDLFYDCEAVRMILGAFAPYAVPKVKNERLVKDVGFKTRVTLGDIFDILKAWRESPETPFKASIKQMSKLYAFVWNEMAASKQKTMENLMSGPFIFIPYSSFNSHDDVVCGTFSYPNEVYWHDSTGSVQQMKEFHPQCSSSHLPINKSLYNIYPGLHGFFVDECGVQEEPPLRSYIQILLQLSTVSLPSQAADKIFHVFLKWADGLKSGLLSVEDVIYLKECLSKLEFPVLPTVQDKWVSLHPSFGLVCWCDDKKLKKEFKHSDNLDFLYFGELTDDDKEIVQEKISVLMKKLGIPAISEVVTREAIYYGLADCSLKESLINWMLPYAQRYIYKLHSDKYVQLKESGFNILNNLKVIVVQKLFYRNVIKSGGSVSNKRVECSCLLQGNILYTAEKSDYHSLFMELSGLLLDGTSELHLANFLLMITTMAESGSSKEQIEYFILNSQKVPTLPDEEPVWVVSSVSSLVEADGSHPSAHVPSTNQQIFPRRKTGVYSNWPPADWKTAPDFSFARANGFKTNPAQVSSFSEVKKDDNSESIIAPPVCAEQGSVAVDWTIKDDLPASSLMPLHENENENLEDQSYHDFEPTAFSLHAESDPVSLGEALDESLDEARLSSPAFSNRVRLQTGTLDTAQTKLTGRLGEFLACKYFVDKIGKTSVRWVNEFNETGLPYDIVIGEETNQEFIEVKATRSPRKDWFIITMREWQLAIEKGESFSIAFVAIMGNNVAKITIFKNPVKLCQLGELQLAVMMPRQQKQFSVVS
ncbi:protein NO VEIN [Gastrolobium bilobum]|uniref:protein NO VEIN n=1 Tax=Gastrolobium bilobum TaxID=150636 RepID=UPI002AAF5F98|nr:protein NO VEIN [Gastrolobium bilobum]